MIKAAGVVIVAVLAVLLVSVGLGVVVASRFTDSAVTAPTSMIDRESRPTMVEIGYTTDMPDYFRQAVAMSE